MPGDPSGAHQCRRSPSRDVARPTPASRASAGDRDGAAGGRLPDLGSLHRVRGSRAALIPSHVRSALRPRSGRPGVSVTRSLCQHPPPHPVAERGVAWRVTD